MRPGDAPRSVDWVIGGCLTGDLNQWWPTPNCSLQSALHWNLNQNTKPTLLWLQMPPPAAVPVPPNMAVHPHEQPWEFVESLQKFQCNICRKLHFNKVLFSNKRSIQRHIIRKHTTKQLVCPVCSKVYAHKEDLKRHCKQEHQLHYQWIVEVTHPWHTLLKKNETLGREQTWLPMTTCSGSFYCDVPSHL